MTNGAIIFWSDASAVYDGDSSGSRVADIPLTVCVPPSLMIAKHGIGDSCAVNEISIAGPKFWPDDYSPSVKKRPVVRFTTGPYIFFNLP